MKSRMWSPESSAARTPARARDGRLSSVARSSTALARAAGCASGSVGRDLVRMSAGRRRPSRGSGDWPAGDGDTVEGDARSMAAAAEEMGTTGAEAGAAEGSAMVVLRESVGRPRPDERSGFWR